MTLLPDTYTQTLSGVRIIYSVLKSAHWIVSIGAIYIVVLLFEVKVVFPLEARILTDNAAIASLLFLPHAARVLSTIIVGPKAFFALLGAMVFYDTFISSSVMVEPAHIRLSLFVVGASCAPIAYWLVKFVNRRSSEFGIRLQEWRMVLQIGVVASLLNSLGRAVVLNTYHDAQSMMRVAAHVVFGDIMGLLVGLFVLLFVFRLIARSSLSST